MSFSGFFSSYIGMYITQSFFHSLVAAVIVSTALEVLKVERPVWVQRFHLIVILFPMVSFPFYQIISPDRSSVAFRSEALLDVSRWLNIALWKIIPLNLVFFLVLIVVTAVFLYQELVPVLRYLLEPKTRPDEPDHTIDSFCINNVVNALPGEKPEIVILDEEEPVIFSTTGANAAIYLSTGFISMLSCEHLQAALSHEIAHVQRTRKPLMNLIFLTRVLMFYNPIALIAFRRVVQEEEKICDDIAVSLIGKPDVLAETLEKFYHKIEYSDSFKLKNIGNLQDSLEEYGHNVLLESRITRLKKGWDPSPKGDLIEFSVTLLAVIIINYFIV